MRSVIIWTLAEITCMTAAPAAVTFSVLPITDSGDHSAYYSDVTSSILAAGEAWGHYLPQSGNLELQISFVEGVSTISASSATFASPGMSNGFTLYQTGAAFELTSPSHSDPTNNGADIQFTIGTDILSQLWFDPDPVARTAPVPAGQYDAASLFLRGFARGLVTFGYRNGDGTLPPGQTYQSTFDQHVTSIGGVPYFTGPAAVAIYGGSVPLTSGTVYLLGNSSPGPGADLADDLLNGIEVQTGTRYDISELDLAIFTDSGLQTVPEPETIALLALSGLALMLFRSPRARLRR